MEILKIILIFLSRLLTVSYDSGYKFSLILNSWANEDVCHTQKRGGGGNSWLNLEQKKSIASSHLFASLSSIEVPLLISLFPIQIHEIAVHVHYVVWLLNTVC